MGEDVLQSLNRENVFSSSSQSSSFLRECVSVGVSVCLCEWVCVWERESLSVSVCVCVWERESLSVSVYVFEWACVCECEFVCVWVIVVSSVWYIFCTTQHEWIQRRKRRRRRRCVCVWTCECVWVWVSVCVCLCAYTACCTVRHLSIEDLALNEGWGHLSNKVTYLRGPKLTRDVLYTLQCV